MPKARIPKPSKIFGLNALNEFATLTSIFLLWCYSAVTLAGDHKFYVGLGGGLADVSNSLKTNTYKTNLSIVEGSRLKTSESSHYELEEDFSYSYRLFGGYAISDTIGLELSFYDFSETEATRFIDRGFAGGSTANLSSSLETTTLAVSLSALYFYPLSNRISVFTSLGGIWSRHEKDYEKKGMELELVNNSIRNILIGTNGEKIRERHLDFIYGVGISAQLSNAFESRLTVTGIELSAGRIFDYGVALVYKL